MTATPPLHPDPADSPAENLPAPTGSSRADLQAPSGEGAGPAGGSHAPTMSTLAAVEQVLLQRTGWTQGRLRAVAAGVAGLLMVLLFAAPQLAKSDCDRLGDLIVASRDMGMNERDDHAGEFSDLLTSCTQSDDPLPDEYYTG